MSVDDFKKILFCVNRKTFKGKRDYAILIFFVYTGRRRTEVSSLKYGDIFEEKGSFLYKYKGKGNRENIRILPEPARYALEVYLKCSSRPLKASSPLFSSLNRETQLTGQAIANILKEYADLAGLNPKDYSVHSLRHLSTSLRQASGQSVQELQSYLDHSSISTTQIYLDKIKDKKDESWREISRILNRKED
jgi:integrase/recombinase XerC